MNLLPTSLSSATFRVLPSENPQAQRRLGRQYSLFIAPYDAPRPFLMTYYGSYRQLNVFRHIFLTDYDHLIETAQEKISRRFNHGYQLIGWTPDFPLMDWIQKKSYPISPQPNYQEPAIQLLLPFKDIA